MPKVGQGQITSRKVIVVEGPDDDKFFECLLKSLGVADFDIRFVGGKNEFRNKLPALKRNRGFFDADGSCYVTHFVVIRDRNSDDAFRSIANTLKKEGFTPSEKPGQFSDDHPKVGIFIMPGETIEGTMLEDLCLETVNDRPAMKCVDEFSSCVSALKTKPKNISKAKAQAFLASQPEFANSVGLGAQKGYWNFKSPCLAELKAFLSHLK